jgi:SAM-dependent methyltransferase
MWSVTIADDLAKGDDVPPRRKSSPAMARSARGPRFREPLSADTPGELTMPEIYDFTADWFGGHIPVWQTALAHLAGRPDVDFLEVGCFEGRATVWLLGNILTHPGARIDCVDVFFDPSYEWRFDHNIRTALGTSKVQKRKGRSQEILRGLPFAHYDAVYIDGSHAAVDVLEDAVLAFRLLKPGGVLIFDDYEWNAHQDPLLLPKIAINAFLGIYQRQYEMLHMGYQVIIKKV